MLTRASRSLGTCLAATLVAASSVLATGGPAHALPVDQVCTGTWSVTYNPPITDTLRTVSATLSADFRVA